MSPESQRPEPPASGRPAAGAPRPRDLSTVPSFLREGSRERPDRPERPAAPPARANATLPRPATPVAPEPRHEPALDPAALPMPTLSRRRVITAAGILLAGWLALSFARQVGEATAATTRAAELRAANAELHTEVERLGRDLDQVQDMRFIRLEARAVGLGAKGEVPFALAAGAPSLPADAPGSAAVRLGAEPIAQSPIDAWLEILFGAGP